MTLQGIFYNSHLCQPVAGVVVAALLLSTNQIRTLYNVSISAIVSNSTIVIILLICTSLIWEDKGLESEGLQDKPVETNAATTGFWDMFSSFSCFIFAMSGHRIFFEIMYDMRNPRDFPKGLVTAFGFMLVCYTFISVLCYWHMGTATPVYLMDVLE